MFFKSQDSYKRPKLSKGQMVTHMWSLGHNNWIHYGWGDDLKKIRNSQEHLVYHFDDVPRNETKNSIEAVKYTVDIIAKTYPGPYILMCSGGVDSQAMLYSWYISSHPFHVIFVKYISKNIWFNEHDFINLRLFAEKFNITIEFLEVDVIKFFETELMSYGKNSDCDSYQICTHMKMSDYITSGTVIFSGNFISRNFEGLGYTQTSLHRYSILKETDTKKIIPFFFLHTPEIVEFLMSMTHNEYLGKCRRYLEKGFPILPQEKKINGFEMLKEYYDQFEHKVSKKSKLIYYYMPSKRTIDLLYRYPLGISNAKYSIKTNLKGYEP